MKAFTTTTNMQGPDLWTLAQLPDPEVLPNEVVVQVKAASLNYRDLMVARNKREGNSEPVIPLSDGSGEIVAIGPGVQQWSVGDRVAASFFRRWIDGPFTTSYQSAALGGSVDGMLAQYVTVPAQSLVRLPEYLSFEEGATLPCAALTAWHAFTVTGPASHAGSIVLTLGSGGVSIFALQLAQV